MSDSGGTITEHRDRYGRLLYTEVKDANGVLVEKRDPQGRLMYRARSNHGLDTDQAIGGHRRAAGKPSFRNGMVTDLPRTSGEAHASVPTS